MNKYKLYALLIFISTCIHGFNIGLAWLSTPKGIGWDYPTLIAMIICAINVVLCYLLMEESTKGI